MTDSGNHHVTDLPYYDQGMIVDWSDQKRAFITTTDFDGNYDPARHLYLHLLYDGQLIATLPVMTNYVKGTLSAMVFDPYTNILYFVREYNDLQSQGELWGIGGVPPLPEGELIITPDAAKI